MGGFSFDDHRVSTEVEYQKARPFFELFAKTVEEILRQALTAKGIEVHSVQSRAKTVESLGRKATRTSSNDPSRPKYPNPLVEITDLAGSRVITYFIGQLNEVDDIIRKQFCVTEFTDRTAQLRDEKRFGYQSNHYLVKLSEARVSLPEYSQYADTVAEIQVRTILQHAWAEIEHDIQYKSIDALPESVARRFLTLAGLLEIGDREFQAIADERHEILEHARASVDAGELGDVEITPDSLKLLLDRELGADGRMRDFSYEWAARLVRRLGFTSLEQLQNALRLHNDDDLSRAVFGSRQGQITRFELLLLAALGDEFTRRWPPPSTSTDDFEFWRSSYQDRLRELREAGYEVGSYSPPIPNASDAEL